MLRTAIISGELKPGKELVSTELANQIGVSQATLREAIYTLSVEGLVDTVAYHVPTVKKLSKHDIEELFSVRSMLEVFAIRQVVSTNQTSVAIKELNEICREMAEAAENDNIKVVILNDRKFHDTLIKHTGNDLLGVLWNTVAQRVEQVRSLRNKKIVDLPQIARNHVEIAKAIADKDVDKAVQLITVHIVFVADKTTDHWDEESG
jgi:DNA-binding GntR family transcriptional regulator